MAHFLQPILVSLSQYATSPFFKQFTGSAEQFTWKSITYADFTNDLNRLAVYWGDILTKAGLRPLDVVGVWYVVDASGHWNTFLMYKFVLKDYWKALQRLGPSLCHLKSWFHS